MCVTRVCTSARVGTTAQQDPVIRSCVGLAPTRTSLANGIARNVWLDSTVMMLSDQSHRTHHTAAQKVGLEPLSAVIFSYVILTKAMSM